MTEIERILRPNAIYIVLSCSHTLTELRSLFCNLQLKEDLSSLLDDQTLTMCVFLKVRWFIDFFFFPYSSFFLFSIFFSHFLAHFFSQSTNLHEKLKENAQKLNFDWCSKIEHKFRLLMRLQLCFQLYSPTQYHHRPESEKMTK